MRVVANIQLRVPGEDMGEGSDAWWGQVHVCRRDTICYLHSQQQHLQSFGLMGFESV